MRTSLLLLLLGASVGCTAAPAGTPEPPTSSSVWTPVAAPQAPIEGHVASWPEVGDCGELIPPPPAASPSRPAFAAQLLADRQLDCVVVEDLDGDGYLDLATVGYAPATDGGVRDRVEDGEPSAALDVWYGTGRRSFVHVQTSLATAPPPNVACAARDLDADGDLDMLYGTIGGVAAVRIQGRTFQPLGQVARIPRTAPNPDGLVLWMATLDLDGRPPLDLVAAVHGANPGGDQCSIAVHDGEAPPPDAMVTGSLHCFLGEADGRFERAPPSICAEPLVPTAMLAPHVGTVADLDGDGDGDLFSGNDFGENQVLLRGDRGLDLAPSTGVEVYNHAMGLAIGDFDGDGLRDLYVSELDGDHLYQAGSCLSYFDVSRVTGVSDGTRGTVNWGAHPIDVDSDGALDVAVSTSLDTEGVLEGSACDLDRAAYPAAPLHVLQNTQDGRFADVNVPLRDFGGQGRWRPSVLAHGDLDGDLDDDLVTSVGERTVVLWNETPRAGRVLRLRLRGADGGLVVGAQAAITVAEGGRIYDFWPTTGWQGQSELAHAFAFGAAEGEARVDVRWPDGRVTTHGPFAGDELVTLVAPR